jgi:hypothetical protein
LRDQSIFYFDFEILVKVKNSDSLSYCLFFIFSQLKKLLHFDFLLAVLHPLDQADFFDFSVLDSYFLAVQAFHSHCCPCSLFVDFSKSF